MGLGAGVFHRKSMQMAVGPSLNPSPGGREVNLKLEATIGFEPMHKGFAVPPLNHLGTSPRRGLE